MIRISKNCHGRFTVNRRMFFSGIFNNSKQNVLEFYTDPFKDLSPMLNVTCSNELGGWTIECAVISKHRLMTMSPLYPCRKPCSRGTHNETVKNFAFFSNQWNYDGLTASNLSPVGVFSILQSNRKFYHIYTVTIVIHKSPNLIGTLGIAKFGPK